MPPRKQQQQQTPSSATTTTTTTTTATTTSGSSSSSIEELYKQHEVLDAAGEDAGKHQTAYLAILKAVEGSKEAKIFASQGLPRFFKHFPKLHPQAINALIDLCEDESRDVRVHAIRALPQLCKDSPQHVSQIANVCGQLLLSSQEEDEDQDQEKKTTTTTTTSSTSSSSSRRRTASLEEDAVRRSFLALLRIDTAASLTSLFQQMAQDADPDLRERAVAFFRDQVMAHADELLHGSAEVEQLVADGIRRQLPRAIQGGAIDDTGATGNLEELRTFVDALRKLNMFSSSTTTATSDTTATTTTTSSSSGPRQLLDMVTEGTGLESMMREYDPTAAAAAAPGPLRHILAVLSLITDLYRARGAPSSRPFAFLVHKVLPRFDDFDDKTRLQTLHAMAELAPHTTTSDARDTLPTVYSLLQRHMPLPVTTATTTTTTGADVGVDSEAKKSKEEEQEQATAAATTAATTAAGAAAAPEINFSYVESLLYVFHQLADKAPGALNPLCGIKIVTGQPQDMADMADYPDRRRDLHDRLQYVERQSNEYAKHLRSTATATATGTTGAATTDDDRQRALARRRQSEFRLRLVRNVARMAAALRRKSPAFCKPHTVDLSWSAKTQQEIAAAATAATQPKRLPERALGEAPPAKKTRQQQQQQSYVPPHRRAGADDGGTGVAASRGGGGGGRGRGRRGRRRGGRGGRQ